MVSEDAGRAGRKPFFLRFTKELHEQLAAEARASERSLNSEIVYRLRQSLRTAEEAAA